MGRRDLKAKETDDEDGCSDGPELVLRSRFKRFSGEREEGGGGGERAGGRPGGEARPRRGLI